MATEKQLNTRIQLKYDTLANWNANNGVVLRAGEIGICVIETGSALNGDNSRPQILFKVGDGKTQFSNLAWASAKAADVYDWAKQSALPIVRASSETGDAGNVIASISWNASTNKVEYTTASVTTSEGMKKVADDLDLLEAAVAAMYTNAKIDELVADAKKAGTNASDALDSYKITNNAAVAEAKKAGTDAAAALEAYKGTNDQVISDINAAIEDIVDGTTTITNATNALKATQDAAGNVITATYETKADAGNYQTTNNARVKAVEDSVTAINNAESGILATAKAYTDEKASVMKTRVAKLEAIDHAAYAKSADVVSNNTFDEFKNTNTAAIAKAAGDAESAAKAYADEIKKSILTGDSTEELDKAYDTLLEIQQWMADAGSDATDLSKALADETTARQNADKTLQDNIDAEAGTREAADNALGDRIDDVIDGTIPVAEATHATKATQDNAGNVISTTYETKADAAQKLKDAKAYADQAEADAITAAKNYTDEVKGALEAADEAIDGRLDTLEDAFNNGVANEAAKVSNALTVTMVDGTTKTFDGSAATTINLTNLATKTYVDQAEADALSAAKTYTDDEISEFNTTYQADKAAMDKRVKAVEDDYLKDVTVGAGLKVSNSPDVHGRLVEIDEAVTFVFNCGSSTVLVD